MTTPELSTALVSEELELYRRMWVLRLVDMALEESRMDGLLNGPMEAAFGQEAVAVGTTAALRPGDIITTTVRHFRHARQVGLALPLAPELAELTGAGHGAEGDWEGSSFVADWRQLFSSPGTLGQSALFALGDAYSQRLAGEGNITLCVIGGRDANSTEFNAAACIAVSWRLPVVFVFENIRDARTARPGSYVPEPHGMPVLTVDGKNVAAVRDSVAEAVQQAGTAGGPILVNAVTYRTNHPAAGDPLVCARRRLVGAGVSSTHLYEVERRARHLVAEAEAVAKAMVRAEEPMSVREPERWSAAN